MNSTLQPLWQRSFFQKRRNRRRDEALHHDTSADRGALLEALIGVLPLPIFFKDLHGRYVGCNKVFEDLLGRSRDEIIGNTDFDLSSTQLAEIYSIEEKGLLERGGAQVSERKIALANGAILDVVCNKAVF
ncbi:PAS domain S-box-containing protein [Rhizobium etli]|nr:PAS domain S-box-containing protein [Rhizobium etli]MBB4538811.1 PAS domain S-box-containing protein [Rhizobium etli]